MIDQRIKPEKTQIFVVEVKDIKTGHCQLEQLTHRQAASTQPNWSPDGQFITFRSERGIFIMNADGSNQNLLTESRRGDFEPNWSPDGQHIVFTRTHENTQKYLYVMRSDGTEVTSLGIKGIMGLRPVWWMDLGNKEAK